jgi:peroxiredoxin
MPELGGMTFRILIAALALLPFSTLGQTSTPDPRGFVVKVGEAVPDFALTDLDGTEYSRESLLGTPYVLQFTASWCSVCRAEMPHLETEVWQAYKDREGGFVLLGVDYDEPQTQVRAFAEQMRVTYPMCPDDAGAVFHSIAAKKSGVTRNVVVDRQGNIAMLTRLFDETEFQTMVELLNELTSTP